MCWVCTDNKNYFMEDKMKTVETIINNHGGMDVLKENPIKVKSKGFMDLCIEYIGEGPRGYPMVSVAHYYFQNGDAMRDPDMVFEVSEDMGWGPISYRQDGLGIFQEAVYINNEGKTMINSRLVLELKSFARFWNRNLKIQGFIEASKKEAKL